MSGLPHGCRALALPGADGGRFPWRDVVVGAAAFAAGGSATHVQLAGTTSGAYAGSAIERANRRELRERYGEDCFAEAVDDFGTTTLLLDLSVPGETIRAVLDDVARIADYAVLDDGTYAAVVDEMIDGALADWAAWDVAAALRDAHGIDVAAADLTPDVLHDALLAAEQAGWGSAYDEGMGDENIAVPCEAMARALAEGLSPLPGAARLDLAPPAGDLGGTAGRCA